MILIFNAKISQYIYAICAIDMVFVPVVRLYEFYLDSFVLRQGFHLLLFWQNDSIIFFQNPHVWQFRWFLLSAILFIVLFIVNESRIKCTTITIVSGSISVSAVFSLFYFYRPHPSTLSFVLWNAYCLKTALHTLLENLNQMDVYEWGSSVRT